MRLTFCSSPDSRAPSVLSVMSSRSSTKTENWSLGGCHVWGFMVLGILLVILAFLLGVIYFTVRTLTTSLEHVETIPTYANAILVMCSGILVLFLYRKRDPLLLVATIVLNMVVTILCATSAILTGIRTIHTMEKFSSCRFSQITYRCYCYVSNSTNYEMETFQAKFDGDLEYVYEGTSSCRVIKKNLKDFVYVLCALYSFSTIVCFSAVTVGLLVFQHYKYSCQMQEDLGLSENMETPIEDSTSFSFVAYSPPPPPEPPPSIESPRRGGQRRPLFTRQIMLPGMGCQPLAQQLGLLGDDPARLLRVNRHDSTASRANAGTCPEEETQADGSRQGRERDTSNQQTENQGAPQPTTGQRVGRQQSSRERTRSRRTTSVPREEGGSIAVAHVRNEQGHRRRRRPLDSVSRQSSFSIYETIVRDRRRRQPQRNSSGAHQRSGHSRASYPYPPIGCVRGRRQENIPNHMSFLNLMHTYGGFMGYGGAFPAPSGPPPPYFPTNLPPYIENDPAPSYRSRESSAPPSVTGS